MVTGVVVNRVAGGGRVASIWPGLESELARLFGPLDVRTTAGPGDGTAQARALIAAGARLIIAVGGDGTLNEVANAILADKTPVELGLIPVGTGRDFLRSFEMPRGVDAALAALASGHTRTIDAGSVTYTARDGSTRQRFFLNVASVGLSGRIAHAVNASTRGKKHFAKALFYGHTIRELLRYRPQTVELRYGDGTTASLRTALVAIANGTHFGAGMFIAPHASISDGKFDILAYQAPGKIQMIADFNRIYHGTHISLPRVASRRALSLDIVPQPGETPVMIEIDGEALGQLPARFELLPGALTLRL